MRDHMIILFILLAVVIGCSSGGGMDWKGSLKGEYAIDDYNAVIAGKYPPPEPVETGNGSASLEVGLDHILKLGKETPIPECVISFFPGLAKRDSTEKATAMEFRIKDEISIKRDGLGGAPGCVGRIEKDGPATEIEIDHARVSLHDDGEFHISIDYRPTGNYEKRRTLRIHRKRGWF